MSDEIARISRAAKLYRTAYILADGSSYIMPSLRGTKRSRDSQDLSQSSASTARSALQTIISNQEIVDRKRAPPVSYRLHPAKYLQMDKMLKSMFFPLITTRLNFGISSFSGINLKNASDKFVDSSVTDPAATLRTRGLYRGLVFFDVRNTAGGITRLTDRALNCEQLPVATTNQGASDEATAYSHYRRFHAQPDQDSDFSDGNQIINSSPTLTLDDLAAPNNIRSLSLGSNLSDIEETAVAGMCYADPAVSQFRLRSVTASSSSKEGAANTNLIAGEDGPDITVASTTWTGPTDQSYFSHMSDAVIRIVDGHLHMDIMNTEQTPCVVEVVIHSKKKNIFSKQQIVNQIWTDVDRHLSAKGVVDAPAPNTNPSGGWQAFFDPTYPLLKLPSKGKAVNYINEVHRSNHVLAPGQSKQLRISLGNLWYKLGNKSEVLDDGQDLPDAQQFPKIQDNAGALYVAVGHSGFEYPQNITAVGGGVTDIITSPGTTSALLGSGFWVGKAHAPSSISMDCQYQDKFYPATFDREPNNILNTGQPRPAAFALGGGLLPARAAVPLSTIIPQRVATSSGVVDNLS